MRSSRDGPQKDTVGSDLCVHPCVCAVCAQVGRTHRVRVYPSQNYTVSETQKPLCGAYPFVGYCGSFLNKLPLPKFRSHESRDTQK